MPPYTLAPVTAADREIVSTIFCSSYASNGWFRLQYRGLSIEEMIPGFSLRFPAGKLARPNCWHLLALDAAQNNKAIAYARWELPERVFKKLNAELKAQGVVMGLDGESEENLLRYAKERDEGYVDGEPVGMDPTVPEETSAGLKSMREKAPAPDSEYIELDGLHTLPEHERKGAGTALLEWGIQLADSEGLSIRLLSTPPGFALYKKFGFVELGQTTFDLARWGGEGDFTYYLMSREPKAPQSK